MQVWNINNDSEIKIHDKNMHGEIYAIAMQGKALLFQYKLCEGVIWIATSSI